MANIAGPLAPSAFPWSVFALAKSGGLAAPPLCAEAAYRCAAVRIAGLRQEGEALDYPHSAQATAADPTAQATAAMDWSTLARSAQVRNAALPAPVLWQRPRVWATIQREEQQMSALARRWSAKGKQCGRALNSHWDVDATEALQTTG